MTRYDTSRDRVQGALRARKTRRERICKHMGCAYSRALMVQPRGGTVYSRVLFFAHGWRRAAEKLDADQRPPPWKNRHIVFVA